MSAVIYHRSAGSLRSHDQLAYMTWLGILAPNTPAMPLSEAHFGGFFVSGRRA